MTAEEFRAACAAADGNLRKIDTAALERRVVPAPIPVTDSRTLHAVLGVNNGESTMASSQGPLVFIATRDARGTRAIGLTPENARVLASQLLHSAAQAEKVK